jgi:hypothetical protein
MDKFGFFLVGLVLIAGWTGRSAQAAVGDAQVEKTLSTQVQSGKEAAASQKTVDRTDDETQGLLDEYRVTLQKIENAKVYNQQLKGLIDSQKNEIVQTRTQIDQVKDTGKDIVPLMLKMKDSLHQFVQMDVPFLPEERANRLKQLDEMMERADVSSSEKFRRILEAYQVENDYGRTIEAYRGLQKVDGKDLTVDFLRVGRVALIYQTLDGDHSGMWDGSKKEWSKLDSSYDQAIQQGLRIARKQIAPDLLKLPVEAPKVMP